MYFPRVSRVTRDQKHTTVAGACLQFNSTRFGNIFPASKSRLQLARVLMNEFIILRALLTRGQAEADCGALRAI